MIKFIKYLFSEKTITNCKTCQIGINQDEDIQDWKNLENNDCYDCSSIKDIADFKNRSF